jgi:TatD DNase family protein
MLIDTHAHFYDEVFKEDFELCVNRIVENQIDFILLPNVDVESINVLLELSQNLSNCIPMMGLHPGYVKEDWEIQLQKIEQTLFAQPDLYCAVGEIGMDLYWDKTFVEAQKLAFRQQIDWAKKLNLPIAIHAREAFQEIFEILDEVNDESLKGVFHCFTGNQSDAEKIISYGGFKLGIGGVVTYKNSHLPEVLKNVGLQHLVLETDAPYLPPVPYRGKRNEPAYVSLVAEKLADIFQVSLREVANITTKNAIELFQLDKWLKAHA